MLFIYNILLLFITITISPFIAYLILFNKFAMRKRLGFSSDLSLKKSNPIWFHAASVGEVSVIAPIIKLLLEENQNLEIIVSNMTDNGNKKSESRNFRSSCCIYIASGYTDNYGPLCNGHST